MNVGPPVFAVTLSPQDQSGEGLPGTVVSYAFVVSNQGNTSDSFALQASGVWTASLSASDTGLLAPGESFTLLVDVAVPPGAADGSLDTTTLRAASSAEPGVTSSARAVTIATTHPIVLALRPLAQSGSGLRGERLVYNFNLTNQGQFTDTLSLGVEAEWGSALSASSSGPLAPGASFAFTLSVTIPAQAAGGSRDTAVITAASTLTPGVNATAQALTTAVVVGLELAPAEQISTGAPGEKLTYVFVLRNSGSLTDTFALTASGAWPSQLSTATSGPLAPGESFTITLNVTIPNEAANTSQHSMNLVATSALDWSMWRGAQCTTLVRIPGQNLYFPWVEWNE